MKNFPTITNKTILTVMGDQIDGSSIYYGIDVPQFQYDEFHTTRTEFDEYIFMTIGKTGTNNRMINSTKKIRMKRGV